MSKSRAAVVSLRLSASERQAAESAAAAAGVSLSEYARAALLERQRSDAVRAELGALASQVAAVGNDLGAELAALRRQVEALPTTARTNVGQHRLEWLMQSAGAQTIPKVWADFWRDYEAAKAAGAALPTPPEA